MQATTTRDRNTDATNGRRIREVVVSVVGGR
jgi:hypothetical protein